MTAFIGEIVGTAILIFIGCSVCAGASLKKSYSYNPGWFSIQFAWGFAVVLAIFTVGKYSGAHFNPAVTLAFAFTGAFSWSLVPTYMVGQFLGAMIGAVAVFFALFASLEGNRRPKCKAWNICYGTSNSTFVCQYIKRDLCHLRFSA